MANPTYIINDYWLKELVLNHNPDLKNFHKEDLIKMIHFCTEEISKHKEVIDKISGIINYEYEFYDDITNMINDIDKLLKEVE